MKALKSHPQIERPRRINSQITLAKYTAGLVLALVGLISAALMKGPIQLVSAETVALGWSYTGFIRLSRVLWLSVLVVMLGGLLEPEAAAQTVSFAFGAKTDFGTGSFPFSVAVGDFNGDGTLDLATANESSNTVSILLGAGTGSFGVKTDFGTASGPESVAVGDFNGDGNLDLAVANIGGATVSILLGTGTGGFGAKTDFGTGSGPASVAVGDFNGDGKLDLAVANYLGDTVSILLGTGTGSFGTKTDFGTGSGPHSVAVGDFNGDGNLDLAVANFGFFDSDTDPETVSILLGTGTGGFGAKTDFGTGSLASSVAVGDFNGDGKLDLAVANASSATVSILLGTGTGGFGAKTDFGTGGGPFSVAVGDFNGDGLLDLAVALANDSGTGTWTVSILLGTGTGSFGAKTDFGTGFLPVSVAVGDFNGDGKLDLVVANFRSNTVSILLNTGPIGFSLGFDSPTVTAQQGTKIRVTVNINRIGGFTGNVTVTPPDPAMGINSKPRDPIATTDTSVTFTLKIKGGAPLGPHQETFTAHDDSGHTIALTLTVIVQ